MKNVIKVISVLALIMTFGCDQGDGRFDGENSDLGWVEFRSGATTTVQAPVSVEIPLSINVPTYRNGLEISYTLTPVEGDYTQFINSTGGSVFVDPSDVTREASIVLPILNGDLGRGFVTIFDVTLSAVDADGVNINIGVDTDSFVVHRVTLPCSNPAVIPSDYFVGSYSLVDVAAVIGPGNGTSNFAPGTVTLSVDPADPNKRIFSAAVLPAFLPSPQDITITFTTDNVVQLEVVNSGIGCSAPQYSYGPETVENSTPWDICNDQSITVTYVEDINVSCGGPYEASFMLTKL